MQLAGVLASKEFTDFLRAAKAFIDLVENRKSDDQTAFIRNVQRSLIDLYSRGLMLPEIDRTTRGDYDRDFVVDMKPIIAFVAQRVPFSY